MLLPDCSSRLYPADQVHKWDKEEDPSDQAWCSSRSLSVLSECHTRNKPRDYACVDIDDNEYECEYNDMRENLVDYTALQKPMFDHPGTYILTDAYKTCGDEMLYPTKIV